MIYLAEITCYDPALSATRTLFFSSAGYTSLPGDTSPLGTARDSIHYEARIVQPGLMRRDMFSQGALSGASTTGFGVLELINEGALDSLLSCGFDGQTVVLMVGQAGAALSTFSVTFRGTMEQCEFTWTRVSVRLRDRLSQLDLASQTTLYAGTNTGSGGTLSGLEGTSSDIGGKPKPRVFGTVMNISPPLVNSGKMIYQVNDGPVASIPAVYDAGLAYSAGTDYTSQADMETNAPASGQYRAWPGGGYFRITPASSGVTGPLTADVTQSTQTVADILIAMATGPGGVSDSDLVPADQTALNASYPDTLGIWIPDGGNLKGAMDEVANSLMIWYGFDRLGRFRMGRIAAPTGTPVATFTHAEIVTIDRVASTDPGKGVPIYKVTIGWGKNYTVQTSGYAGAVPDSRKAMLALDYRSTPVSDMAVKTAHLLAPEITPKTLLVSQSSASAEATRRLNLFKVLRDTLTVRVRVSSAATVDLGDVVAIQLNRFGYTSGKRFMVSGLQPDYGLGAIDLTLWG